MRIFYVCYENLSLQRAPTTHVKEITEHLRKSGNDVILFAPNTGRLKGKTDVKTVYAPTLNVRFISEYLYYLSLFFYLLAYHVKYKADVIYLREMGLSVAPALIGFIFRIPCILEINGIPSVDLKSAGTHYLRRKMYWAFQHLNVLLADRVICVSDNIKRALDRVNKAPHKVVVIENGVNKDLFCPRDKIAARRLLNLEPDGYYLLFVGSFYPRHAPLHTIRILDHIRKKLPGARLVMVGSGYLLESARDLVGELGLTSFVSFVGEVRYEDIPRYITAADACLYLLTGIGKFYGKAALKLFEYMACARPVITDESSGDFIRENEIGIVVPEVDYERAADEIICLLKNDTLRDAMGKNGRRLVLDSFTWDITTRKILDVCEGVVSRGRGKGGTI